VQYLLRNVAPGRLSELLASQRIGWEAKVDTLAYHLSGTGRLPEGCDLLWFDAGMKGRASSGAPPLLPAALARLAQPALASLFDAVPDEREDELILALARACPIEPRRQANLQRFLAEVVASLDEQHLIGLLARYRNELQAACAKPEPLLAPRLSRLLFELPDRPREFAQRLEALSGWVDYFPDPGLAENRLGQWRKVHSFLVSLRNGEGTKRAGLFKSKAKPDYKTLADALRKAMPATVYSDDLTGTMKKKRLRDLGTHIVGAPNFLPPSAWNKITRYFEYGDWNEGARARTASGRPLRTPGGKAEHGRHHKPWYGRWGLLAGIALGCAAAVILFGHLHSPKSGREVALGPKSGPDDKSAGPAETPKATKNTDDKPPLRASQAPSADARSPAKEIHSTRTPYRDKPAKISSSSEQLTSPATPVPDVKPGAENPAPSGEPADTTNMPVEDDDPLPDETEKSSAMSKSDDTSDPVDSATKPKEPEPSARTTTDEPAPPETPYPVAEAETPTVEAVPLQLPQEGTKKRKAKVIPASKHYELDLIGPMREESQALDSFIMVPTNPMPAKKMPMSMTLCRVAQETPNAQTVEATQQNSLALIELELRQLAFTWKAAEKSLRESSKRFCKNGFLLRLKTDQEVLYFALYEPEHTRCVKINGPSLTGTIDGLPREVRERSLRLGAGKIYFADGAVYEFDEAPDGVATLVNAGTADAAQPYRIELKRSEGSDHQAQWKVRVVSITAGDTANESDNNVSKPEFLSAKLYCERRDEGTKVRAVEAIIDEPL
jgi:hypothetical protein